MNHQILINLIGNAIKFTTHGEIIVLVKIETPGLSPTLHFSVKDTGIGIAEDIQPELFNPFIQAENSNNNNLQGTGLGLAICKQMIEMMDEIEKMLNE